jgi:hypothetical protein
LNSALRDYVIIRMGENFDTATQYYDSLQDVFSRSLQYSFGNKFQELQTLATERAALVAYTAELRSNYNKCNVSTWGSNAPSPCCL